MLGTVLYRASSSQSRNLSNVKVVTRAEVMKQHKRDEIDIVLEREGAHPIPYISTV